MEVKLGRKCIQYIMTRRLMGRQGFSNMEEEAYKNDISATKYRAPN